MKRMVLVVLCLGLCALPAFAQGDLAFGIE